MHFVRPLLASTAIVLAPTALATSSVAEEPPRTSLEIGMGLGASLDLPDRAGDHTRLGPGVGLDVPVRWPLTSHAALRARARLDFGGIGTDRVSWALPVDGELVRFHAQGHWALLLAAGATVGPELTVPLDAPVQPYASVGMGVTWLGTYHSFGGDTAHLLDPARNDLDDPRNVDPYTSQVALLTEAGIGLRTAGPLRIWCEIGYSNAWVAARPLAKSPPDLHARREAYGWNAARLGAGVAWTP